MSFAVTLKMTVAANATENASDPVSMGADELIGRYATEEQEPSLNPNALFGNSELLLLLRRQWNL